MCSSDLQSSHPLRGDELSSIATLQNAYLVVENESIHSYGVMANLQWDDFPTATRINVEGGAIFPSWCDSHTHLVFAGSRENEFVDKINGLSYAEIAAKGGGILNSANKLQLASEEDLYQAALIRLREIGRAHV